MVNLADMNLCEPIHLANMNIALYEALANAILHGNHGVESKKVRVTAEIGYNEVKFIIRDEGDGFVPDDIANPTDSKNLYKASGRGIHLMKHFMDEVTYNGIGNEVTLVKKRCPSPAATGNPG
jgi:serine/threonine-protein kinase RsbW